MKGLHRNFSPVLNESERLVLHCIVVGLQTHGFKYNFQEVHANHEDFKYIHVHAMNEACLKIVVGK